MAANNTCNICLETLNNSSHKPVSCSFCNYIACKACAERYLLETTQDPHCMSCRKVWNREFLSTNFTKKFVDNDLKSRRETVLLDREYSMLPATQRYVEAQIKAEKLREESTNLAKLILELQRQQATINNRIYRLQQGLDDLEEQHDTPDQGSTSTSASSNKSNNFVRACPMDECRGFLSTQWKCGICETWVCPDCHEVKGKTRDTPHTCKPECLETAKLLAKDSKPCPKCGSLCTKVDGCNQVFAMCCQTVFNWKTGQIETGAIHAPDYYRWLQRNGQHPTRNPLDIPCGGMPNAQQILRAIRTANNVLYDRISHIYRMIIHIQNFEQHIYRPNPEVGEAANRDLRIKYMRNQINKDKLKVLLQQREKARLKKEEIHNVLQTVVMAATDIFQRAIRNAGRASLSYTEVEEVFKELQELQVFVNEGMSKISKTYSCMTPHILENWDLKNMKS
jgi:hypothetical protein